MGLEIHKPGMTKYIAVMVNGVLSDIIENEPHNVTTSGADYMFIADTKGQLISAVYRSYVQGGNGPQYTGKDLADILSNQTIQILSKI